MHVELPEVGDELSSGDQSCAIESVKTAADVYSPIAGEVIEANVDLSDSPEKLGKVTAESTGWLYKIRTNGDAPDVLESLMTTDEYKEYCKSLDDE
mgnify:CR=1 FL=1